MELVVQYGPLLLALVLAGIAAGLAAGLFGIGGGAIIVPVGFDGLVMMRPLSGASAWAASNNSTIASEYRRF